MWRERGGGEEKRREERGEGRRIKGREAEAETFRQTR
jgi:hypothetical protein